MWTRTLVKSVIAKKLSFLFLNQNICLVLYRSLIIMDDQSKISFDSTNPLCLVIIDYNRKYSHLILVSCYSKFATLLQENARFIEYS